VLRESLGEQVVATYLNVPDAIERVGASLGIDTDGLIRAQEEIQAEQDAMQQQAVVEKLGPQAMKLAAEQQQPQ
jgi:hypothetical protein